MIMEMIDYSASNDFLRYTYDLFEAVYLDVHLVHRTETTGKIFKKKVDVYVNEEAEEKYHKAVMFAEKLKMLPPSFDDLFDFGTYIKCMEKVFFYKNDLGAKVCCDSNLQDKTSRKLIFNLNNIVLVFKLDRLNRVDEYIDIIVSRKYGKKMESKYSIKNQEMQYNDCNDLMLTNTINIILETVLPEYFMMIIDKIYNKSILDLDQIGQFYRATDIPIKDVNDDET